MHILRNFFRLTTVACVTASAAMLGAPAAQASGVGLASFNTCDDAVADITAGQTVSQCVSGVITARVVRGTGTVIYVHFECVATAVYHAASVTMDECSLDGVSAIDVPHTAPGAANTQSGVTVANRGVEIEACVGATAAWILSPTPTGDSTCRTVSFEIMP